MYCVVVDVEVISGLWEIGRTKLRNRMLAAEADDFKCRGRKRLAVVRFRFEGLIAEEKGVPRVHALQR